MFLSFIKNIDIFSQTFSFDQQKQRLRKRTLLGAILTVTIIALTLLYLIAILIEYFTNQIDPLFKSQTFIANSQINVDLKTDYFAYQLSQNGLNPIHEVEKKKNKTYVVPLAQFVYQDNTGKKSWYLKTIQCQNPSLVGYDCLDFSNVPSNYTIALDNNQNIYSYVMVMLYRCQDTDGRKTTVPDNCASLNDINAYLNSPATYLKVQIQVSQFNTTTKQMESCYRSQILLVSTSNIAISELKMSQQSTSIRQGVLLQSNEIFNSPISYEINTQMFDPNTINKVIGLSYFTQFHINLDEFQVYTSIQFPNLPTVLAQINSTLTLLMCLGIVGKYFAQRLIRQDLFILVLKNIFQDNYSQVLGYESKLLDENQFQQKSCIDAKENEKQENIIVDQDICQSVSVSPSQIKQSGYALNQINKFEVEIKDEIKEEFNLEIQKSNLNSQNYDNKNSLDSKENILIASSEMVKRISVNKQKDEEQQRVNEDDLFQVQVGDMQQSPIQQNPNIKFFTKVNDFNKQDIESKKDNETERTDKNKIDEKIKILFDQLASQNAEDKIFKFKFKDQESYLDSLGLGQQGFQFIDQQVDNSIDFSKIVEELMFLKKAVMMILNRDQLAALKLVGCSKEFLNQHIKNRNSSYSKMTYFEEQFAVSLSIERQSNLIKQFITKCQTQNNLSITDKRIYSSLV